MGSSVGNYHISGANQLCIGYTYDRDSDDMIVPKANSFVDNSSLTYFGENNAKVLYITGGADVTNTELIAWLQANATRV